MKEKNTLEKLEEFKKNSGWSYLQLAVAMGIHYQTINNWFVKKSKPSPMALEKIQKFLKFIEKSRIQEDLNR